MRSRAQVWGHPIHPMLITVPLGLLPVAVALNLLGWARQSSFWSACSFYLLAIGVVGGLVAAVFGAIDWVSLPRNTRARAVGAWHGLGNVLVVLLFAASWLIRAPDPTRFRPTAAALEVLALLGALGTAWLGGELVFRLGVGVDSNPVLGASPSAPAGTAVEMQRTRPTKNA